MKYKNVQIADITLFKNPKLFFQILWVVLIDTVSWLVTISLRKFYLLLLIIATWAALNYVSTLQNAKDFVIFALRWIILGVASSIGLGTGLHTFVLYLGPHIAKVTLIASSCGHLPQMLPSRWVFDHFGLCNQTQEVIIGFLGILLAVQIEGFLWGLGTALGELPPYFVARKASLTKLELEKMTHQEENKKLIGQKKQKNSQEKQKKQEQNEGEAAEIMKQIDQLKRKPNKSFLDKAKLAIISNLGKYGFTTVLLCASIPNPLFDLAGIMCGHFLVPFRTFFGATFIGKAIIKVHLQMLFVITIFRKQTVDWILDFIRSVNPSIAQTAAAFLEKQRKVLHQPSQFSEDKPLFAKIWDVFIMVMIGYFILSIINSQVQEKALQLSHKNSQKQN